MDGVTVRCEVIEDIIEVHFNQFAKLQGSVMNADDHELNAVSYQ